MTAHGRDQQRHLRHQRDADRHDAAVAAAVGKDEAPPVVPKPKSAPRRNKVPAAGPPVKKTIVKKVPLDEGDKEGVLKPRRRNKA